MVPGQSHDFPVARVVGRLDTDNVFAGVGMRRFEVLGKLVFSAGRSDDQNLARVRPTAAGE
jgi:hypothetical protein